MDDDMKAREHALRDQQYRLEDYLKALNDLQKRHVRALAWEAEDLDKGESTRETYDQNVAIIEGAILRDKAKLNTRYADVIAQFQSQDENHDTTGEG